MTDSIEWQRCSLYSSLPGQIDTITIPLDSRGCLNGTCTDLWEQLSFAEQWVVENAVLVSRCLIEVQTMRSALGRGKWLMEPVNAHHWALFRCKYAVGLLKSTPSIPKDIFSLVSGVCNCLEGGLYSLFYEGSTRDVARCCLVCNSFGISQACVRL